MSGSIKEFKSLFRTFIDYPHWDHRLFFEQIEKYLTDSLHLEKFSVFSYPSVVNFKEKAPVETLRSLWNKEGLQGWLDDPKFKDVLISFEKRHNKEIITAFDSEEDGRWLLLLLNDSDEEQRRVAIVSEKKVKERTFEMLEHVLLIMRSHHKLRLHLRDLEKSGAMIYADDVTNLYNQRKLALDIKEAIVRHEKYAETFAILFIDIDHFKRVNDGHGHLVGTILLKEMAYILKKVLRESDLVYRYGGDEFVMVVPKAETKVARNIGERVLRSIRDHTFKIKDAEPFKLSVSIGIAEFPKDAYTCDEVLAMADNMMYKAKQHGRGQVCMADEFFT